MVMTLGNLHPRNIMVTLAANQDDTHEKVVKISAIIDEWPAVWYPESWKFVKAVSAAAIRGPLSDWKNFLPTDAMGNYIIEYSLDRL
jgi:hypothetical protein